jgi:hypothetical protein
MRQTLVSNTSQQQGDVELKPIVRDALLSCCASADFLSKKGEHPARIRHTFAIAYNVQGLTSISGHSLCGADFSAPVLEPFENRRNALTAADAHGDQRIAAVDTLQFIERLGGDHRARCADGMA